MNRSLFMLISLVIQWFSILVWADGLDETWTLTINGQSVKALPGGGFRFNNISAPDRFGAGGPGTAPDGLSDEWFRLQGVQSIGNTNRYVYSRAFRIQQGGVIVLDPRDLEYRDTPLPSLTRLVVQPELRVFSFLGQTSPVQVIGYYSDGTTNAIPRAADGTTLRTSNPAVLEVLPDGVAVARGKGSAFITASNESSTGVARVEVRPGVATAAVEGFVRTAFGQPAVGAQISSPIVPGVIVAQAGGAFLIPSVPLDFTNLVLNATYNSNWVGSVTFTSPLRPGTNDVGVIVVSPPSEPEGMVLIPAGEFMMGDTLDGLTDAPVHPVYVSAFYMDKTEVTMALWDEVRNWALANGYARSGTRLGKAPNHPIHSVNWYDCVKWCNARSEKAGLTPAYYTDTARTVVYRTGEINLAEANVNWTGGGYRLPTEAEWEKAARGGLTGQRFPWGANITHAEANYRSFTNYAYDTSPTRDYHPTYATGGIPYTSPVGSFAANGYNLFDMAGNQQEWIWDWFGIGYYTSSARTNPHGAASGLLRVMRGGSGTSNADAARCAHRSSYNPIHEHFSFGFRCVR